MPQTLISCACDICCPPCEGSVLWLLLSRNSSSQCVFLQMLYQKSMENLTCTLKILLKFQRTKQITSACSPLKEQKCISPTYPEGEGIKKYWEGLVLSTNVSLNGQTITYLSSPLFMDFQIPSVFFPPKTLINLFCTLVIYSINSKKWNCKSEENVHLKFRLPVWALCKTSEQKEPDNRDRKTKERDGSDRERRFRDWLSNLQALGILTVYVY